MKKCPFCAEEIQEDALKCKHCGEFLKGGVERLTKEEKYNWNDPIRVIGIIVAIVIVILLVLYYAGYWTS